MSLAAHVLRLIVVYRVRGRAVFPYRFAKNHIGNISPDQLQRFRPIGANSLIASAAMIRRAVDKGEFQEIEDDEQT